MLMIVAFWCRNPEIWLFTKSIWGKIVNRHGEGKYYYLEIKEARELFKEGRSTWRKLLKHNPRSKIIQHEIMIIEFQIDILYDLEKCNSTIMARKENYCLIQ